MKQIKRITAFFIVLVMLSASAGCGSSAGNSDPAATTSSQTHENAVTENTQENESENTAGETTENGSAEVSGTESGGSNILVVYFSRTGEQYTVGVIDKGNTAIVAEMIADAAGADMFEVLPQEDYYPYTYKELTDVAKKEQNDKARPVYRGPVPDISEYSTIFVGAPVWWGDWPMIMYTFFENEDLSGKTLIPFSTHEGSGLSGFDRKLSSSCPDATVLDGLAVRGNDAQNDQNRVRQSVNDWVSGLGY